MYNRCRQYYGTFLSPTYFKLFKYLYNFSDKRLFLNLEKSCYYNEIIKYNYLIKNFNLNKKKIHI
jgi:hypothetical protein